MQQEIENGITVGSPANSSSLKPISKSNLSPHQPYLPQPYLSQPYLPQPYLPQPYLQTLNRELISTANSSQPLSPEFLDA
jgi:hypothetical protein